MKKYILIFITLSLLLSGCSKNSISDIEKEAIETFEVTEETQIDNQETNGGEDITSATNDENLESELSLDEKMSSIQFTIISGLYSRNVTQEDYEFTEMFSIEKNNFVRVSTEDLEREVFAYNYVSDDFTYIYYLDGEMVSKTILNVSTGAVIEDVDGNADLLKIQAEEIKTYFYALLETANLSLDELK